jgi:hypothetical protein
MSRCLITGVGGIVSVEGHLLLGDGALVLLWPVKAGDV